MFDIDKKAAHVGRLFYVPTGREMWYTVVAAGAERARPNNGMCGETQWIYR